MSARTRAFENVVALSSRVARARHKNNKLVPAITIPPGTFVDKLPIPKDYDDAVTGPYRNYWIPAIANELRNLRKYNVWAKRSYPKELYQSGADSCSVGNPMRTITWIKQRLGSPCRDAPK